MSGAPDRGHASPAPDPPAARADAPAFPHLRVWLEPGYEGSFVGGWALDVPGIFGAGRTPEAALTATLGATARVRAWLEQRGQALDLPPLGRPEIAGVVPARHEADGYEVNATFDADRRPLGEEELGRVTRWLTWGREDLLDVAARIAVLERARGPLPTDDAGGERDADGVLRHVAGAEAWLVGRLDAAARYEGPLRDGAAAIALARTRAWALDELQARRATDTGGEVEDRHGETWTLAKVARRLVYHGFDHLWELERRLARADGSAERIRVRVDVRPDGATLAALLRTVGWDVRASDPEALEAAAQASSEMATAWDGDRLVGTARLMSDATLNGLIAMVVVHPGCQGLGVGDRLMHALMDGRDRIRFTLATAPGMDEWYRRFGFEPDPTAMVRARIRHRA